MPRPIVLQLQEDAIGTTVSVSELLRKALVVASKLDIADFRAWLSCELDGYKEVNEDFPAYRRISGELRAQNPLRGPIPVMFEDPDLGRAASQAPIVQPASELESLCSSGGQRLVIRREQLERHATFSTWNDDLSLPIYLHIGKAQIQSILQHVRTIVLNWSLDLERQGILGDGLSFTSAERTAAHAANYVVNNYFGTGGVAQINHGDHGVQSAHSTSGLSPAEIDTLIQSVKEAPLQGAQALDVGILLGQLRDLVKQPIQDKSKMRSILVSLKDVAQAASASGQLVQQIGSLVNLLS